MLNNTFKPVQSLQRGLKLLEVISQRREGAFLKDLAAEIDCSSAAAFHLVHTLVDSGYVQRLEDPARYVLGEKLRHLVTNQQQDRFYRVAHDVMRGLGREFPGISVHLSEYIGGSVVVTAQFQPTHSNQIIYKGQNRGLPPFASAGSFAHLGFWPQEIRDEYEARYPFQTYGAGYWQSRTHFEEALRKLQKDRLYIMPEPSPLTLKLAVPLFPPDDTIAAALTLHWNLPTLKDIASRRKQLLAAARTASTTFTQKLI